MSRVGWGTSYTVSLSTSLDSLFTPLSTEINVVHVVRCQLSFSEDMDFDLTINLKFLLIAVIIS